MFDILNFIDSKDIREYNKNTKFTPFEKAYLIYNCKKPLQEKLSALKELLNTYTEEDFGEINEENTEIGFHMPDIRSRKKAIENTVNFYQSLLDKRFSSKNVVIGIRLLEYDDDGFEIDSYYTSYERAFECIKKKCSEYDNSNCLCSIEIIMIKLDCEYSQDSDEKEWISYSFNDKFEISNVYIFDKDNDCMENLTAVIPVPLKKGDILKFKSAGKVDFGVLAYDLSNDKYIATEISVDIFFRDEHGNWKYGYDHVPILEIEICNYEDLPNEYAILKYYSDLQFGKISSRDFFLMFSYT